MGAETFFTHAAEGDTAEAAFKAAVEQAQYDYGHAGYTGTIAEKDSFTVIETGAANLSVAEEKADALLRDDDPRISDKWGPAGAIGVVDGTWLFFGWASS